MEIKKHGGKRSNAGRKPLFTKKEDEVKAIYIKVLKDDHTFLAQQCKELIKKFYETRRNKTN